MATNPKKECFISNTIIVRRSEIRLRNVFKLPPQPLWFPPTTSMKPEKGGKKEAIRLNDVVRQGAVIGFVTEQSRLKPFLLFTPLSLDNIINYILCPHSIPPAHQFLVQKEGGRIFPINLPDNSDLAMHPKVFRGLMEWMVTNCTQENLNEVLTMFLRETATEMLTRRETYTMGKDVSSEVKVSSGGNYFKAVDIDASQSMSVMISVAISQTTSDERDGRTYDLSLRTIPRVTTTLKRKRVMEPLMVGLLIWNCRGVASWGFPTAMECILEAHQPRFVILLETRVPERVLHSVIKKFGITRYAYNKPVGGTRGVAILSMIESNEISVMQNSYNEFQCMLNLK